jgi:hypothetical protein
MHANMGSYSHLGYVTLSNSAFFLSYFIAGRDLRLRYHAAEVREILFVFESVSCTAISMSSSFFTSP